MELKCIFTDIVVIFIFYVRVTFCFTNAEPLKQCIPNDDKGCSCKFTDGSGIVDLRSLGTSDGTPMFKDIQGDDENLYSFSACNGFTEGSCTDAAMCVTEEGYQTQIGDPGKTMFMYSEDSASVTAAYVVRGSLIKVSEVEFVCDATCDSPLFSPQGQTTPGLFKFKLKHVCSCPGLCNENGPISCPKQNGGGGGAFGPGTIVLIMLFSVIVVYIAAGLIYQKVKKKASGTDLIPNKDMWKNLKDLVTTGFKFTFSKCLPKRFQYSSMN